MRHKGFLSSKSEDRGWYTTTEENEVIEFEYPINALLVETQHTPITIKIGDYEDLWHLAENDKEGIQNMKITKIQVLEPAGVTLRWKALVE